jgi:histidine ammonia-lyase
VLERDPLREPMPSYQAVDFLRRAEESRDAPREAVEEIRRRVLDEGEPARRITRQYSDVVFPIDEDTLAARDAAGVKNVARRLRELLGETKAVPRGLASEASAVLDRVLDAIEEREEAA